MTVLEDTGYPCPANLGSSSRSDTTSVSESMSSRNAAISNAMIKMSKTS